MNRREASGIRRARHMEICDTSKAIEQLKALASSAPDPASRDVIRVLGDAIEAGNISNFDRRGRGRNMRQVIDRFDVTPEGD